MTFDLTQILGEFRDEAEEHIEALNVRLLELERDPSATEAIRAMFLSAHTIKGSAAMLDLQQTTMLAHAVEDVLAYLRDQRQPLDRETADLMFKSLDVLRSLINTPVPGEVEPDPAVLELSFALRRHARERAVRDMQEAATPPEGIAGPRALLVDDSATVRLLETMQLNEAGYTVDAVADGMEALDMAVARRYDAIVTGIECEGLRGWDLVAALQEVVSSRPSPIIVMSSDRDSDPRNTSDMGVYAYLRKGSLSRQDLLETGRSILAQRDGVIELKSLV